MDIGQLPPSQDAIVTTSMTLANSSFRLSWDSYTALLLGRWTTRVVSMLPTPMRRLVGFKTAPLFHRYLAKNFAGKRVHTKNGPNQIF